VLIRHPSPQFLLPAHPISAAQTSVCRHIRVRSSPLSRSFVSGFALARQWFRVGPSLILRSLAIGLAFAIRRPWIIKLIK